MSKNFVSEVRRLKNGSLHTGTLKSITVDIESSSTPDTSASEIVTAENDNEDVEELAPESLINSDHNLEATESEHLTQSTPADAQPQVDVAAMSNAQISNAQIDIAQTDVAQTDGEHLVSEAKSSNAESSHTAHTESSNHEPEEVQTTVSFDSDDISENSGSQFDTEDTSENIEDINAGESSQPESLPIESLIEPPQPESLQASSLDSTADVGSLGSADQSASQYQQATEAEAFCVEAYVVEDEDAVSDLSSSADTLPVEVTSVEPTKSEPTKSSKSSSEYAGSDKADALRNIKAVEKSESVLEIAALKTELQEALHHEERLENQVAELNERLKQHEKDLSHLKLELGHAQCSNTILSDELAEAKQYILKLTEAAPAPATPASPPQPSVQPSSLQEHPSQNKPAQKPALPQTSASPYSSGNSLAGGRSPRPAVISPRRMPSRPIGNIAGLPPMSTESLSSPGGSSPGTYPGASHSSQRSPQPSPPRSQASQTQVTRQPLNLPERQASPSEPTAPATQSETTSTQIQLSTHKPAAMRRFSRPGLSRLEEDIPVAARDTETKDVKPKLSDDEISWFD
ncbi:MAG: hypothetical protein WBA57_11215 [Elainellaceae cyanobacterium]